MTVLSPRHARWLVVLLGLCLVPVVAVELRPRRRDDCRNPDMLLATVLIPGSKPRPTPRDRRSEDVIQWSEGELENPVLPRRPLRFYIVRSFDRAYTSPVRLLGKSIDAESVTSESVATRVGELPIGVAVDHTRAPSRILAWAYVFDGRAVASPFLSIVSSAPQQLLLGTLPLSLLLIEGVAPEDGAERVVTAAKAWLAAAWEHVAVACR